MGNATFTAPGPPEADGPALARRDLLGIVALALGVALIVVDISIVNLILAPLGRDLGLGFAGLQWVGSLFPLCTAAIVVPAGRLSDRFGPRRVYVAGLGVFTAASLLAALAPSEAVLLGARALQGAGGGVVLTAALSTISAVYVPKGRAAAFALYGATFGAAGGLGPLAGAVLADAASWRWAFGVNLLVGPVVIAAVLRLVPPAPARAQRRSADWGGTALISLVLGALVFAVVQVRSYGWLTAKRPYELLGVGVDRDQVSPSALAFAASLLLAAAFVGHQARRRRRGRSLTVPTPLLQVRSFVVGCGVLLVVALGEFGLLFLVPLVLEASRELSPLQAGLVVLPTALASLAAFPLTQAIQRRRGARASVRTGIALEVAGIAGIALAAPHHPVWFLPGLAVYGLGVGLAVAQLTSLVLADVPPPVIGVASGVASAIRQLGTSLGVAVLGSVFAGAVADRAARAGGLDALSDQPLQTLAALRTAGRDAVAAVASRALEHGLQVAATLAAAVLAVAWLATRTLAAGARPPGSPAPAQPTARDSAPETAEAARP
jgi:EmrB/QacA subfamily drug resistance transporter